MREYVRGVLVRLQATPHGRETIIWRVAPEDILTDRLGPSWAYSAVYTSNSIGVRDISSYLDVFIRRDFIWYAGNSAVGESLATKLQKWQTLQQALQVRRNERIHPSAYSPNGEPRRSLEVAWANLCSEQGITLQQKQVLESFMSDLSDEVFLSGQNSMLED